MPTTWNSVLTRASARVSSSSSRPMSGPSTSTESTAAMRQSIPSRIPQPVEDEGGDRGDGAVGEVEHAGGLVREHEADAREAVDRPDR